MPDWLERLVPAAPSPWCPGEGMDQRARRYWDRGWLRSRVPDCPCTFAGVSRPQRLTHQKPIVALATPSEPPNAGFLRQLVRRQEAVCPMGQASLPGRRCGGVWSLGSVGASVGTEQAAEEM